MENLKGAIKRIENKGKKSVDPKKNEITEVAPVVGAAAKAAAKGVVARKLTKRRNVRNPKYRKFEKDDKGNIVKGKEFDKKLYDQDGNKKTQGYMSTIDDGADKDGKIRDTRAMSGHPDNLRQKKKEEEGEKRRKEERDKKVQDKAQDLKKKTGDAVKGTVKRVGSMAKKATSATSSAFGTSSFAKEGITFKDYLNKL